MGFAAAFDHHRRRAPYEAIGGCREVNKTHHFSEIYSIFSKSRSR
jgi:hypothetical protein